MMHCCLCSILFLLWACSRVGAACVDTSMPVHSAVSIERSFDDEEKTADPDLLGIQGTGWFLSASSLLTAAHVVEAMHLSQQHWKQIAIRDDGRTLSIPVRIRRTAGSYSEKIAVLEMATSFPGAKLPPTRTEPLAPDKPVMSHVYTSTKRGPRFAPGRFVQYGHDKLAGTALFELYDGHDRLVIDYGASGVPVLDCQGRAVAVVSNAMTQTIQFLSRVIRVSTPW